VSFAICYANDYGVVPFEPGNDGKFFYVYIKPYVRIVAYLIGMSVGWIIYTFRKYNENGQVFDILAHKIGQVVVGHRWLRYAMFVVGFGLLNFVLFI
jgi:hypothetical protein